METMPPNCDSTPAADAQWQDITYFTYGSNMKSEKLRTRMALDGTASITYSDSFVACLPDWELCFDLFVVPPQEPAMGSIQRVDGAQVYGVCYTIDSASSWAELLESEGGKDNCYLVIDVEVRVMRKGVLTGEVLPAKTLVTSWEYIIPRSCRDVVRPSKRYVDVILEGAREHKLPAEYVQRLEQTQVARKPQWSILKVLLPMSLSISYIVNDLKVKWMYRPLSFTMAHLFAMSERAVLAGPMQVGTKVLGLLAYIGIVCIGLGLAIPGWIILLLHPKCRSNVRRYNKLIKDSKK